MEFVLATANPGKAVEISEILGDRVELLPRPPGVPDVDETGTTLLDNARLKALALVDATGKPAIADDTGLEVDALDGAPGVYSARFAGEHVTYADNVAKMLRVMADVLPPQRSATFKTVALARWPDGRELVAEGTVRGLIAVEPQGDGGFGYDPIFVPEDASGRTFAQMTTEEKDAISHRGRAFRALAEALEGESDRD